MSYPSGAPGGYPGQPTQQSAPVFGRPPQRPNPFGALGLPGLLCLVVAALSLVSYFCSFSSDSAGLGLQVAILLTGGLLAALDLLPKAPDTLPFAALLSTVGGLTVLSTVIGGTLPTIAVIILVFALLQFLVSVVALLIDHGVIKLAPRTAVPYRPPAGGPGNTGAFPAPGQQQPGHQQPGHQQPPAPGNAGPGNPGPGNYGGQAPGQGSGQGSPPPKPTQFMQQPGQLSQPGDFGQPGQSGQSGQSGQ